MGFGSAGTRHYRNLLKLGYRRVFVFDPDKKVLKGTPRTFSDWKDVRFRDFEVVFICGPNHLHMRAALSAAKAGCQLFIEKPLAHRLPDARRLAKLCAQKKLITLVGCNLRFHPCLAFIKRCLEKRRLGNIYGIHHEFGYYLPLWRKGGDYRRNYAARKNTGGGIILDDIHEFDLLFWLSGFSRIRASKFIFAKSGNLKIETEDNCVASFRFSTGALGSIRCDYLQRSYSRNCKIVGEKGNLFWDFHENIVWFETEHGRKKLFGVKNYDINKMYIAEVAYFLDCVAKKKRTKNDVVRALTVLRYCVERR